VAAAQRRPAAPLYHSALEVHADGATYVVEMTPVWPRHRDDRGVVAVGPVGSRLLGRLRAFRYEIRLWRGGAIGDVAAAVGGPVRLGDADAARRLLALAPSVPVHVWGRDELGARDMWNSNSVVAWLLAGAGIDAAALAPPGDGRAPGWRAGLLAAGQPLR
jgi:hypothetical protein